MSQTLQQPPILSSPSQLRTGTPDIHEHGRLYALYIWQLVSIILSLLFLSFFPPTLPASQRRGTWPGENNTIHAKTQRKQAVAGSRCLQHLCIGALVSCDSQRREGVGKGERVTQMLLKGFQKVIDRKLGPECLHYDIVEYGDRVIRSRPTRVQETQDRI